MLLQLRHLVFLDLILRVMEVGDAWLRAEHDWHRYGYEQDENRANVINSAHVVARQSKEFLVIVRHWLGAVGWRKERLNQSVDDRRHVPIYQLSCINSLRCARLRICHNLSAHVSSINVCS